MSDPDLEPANPRAFEAALAFDPDPASQSGPIEGALRALTIAVCHDLEGAEIPKRSVWTVANSSEGTPYVALDVDRPALVGLHSSLSMGLFQFPEYDIVAEACEQAPGLREGIMIDAGGFLLAAERLNVTRALMTKFLWRYLREGERLDWDETRFVETFNELLEELRRKTVVFHTILPLSNLKMDIASLDFGDGLKLLPASTGELERWLNRDQGLGPYGAGPPQWNTHYVDRPGVLHARQTVVGRPRSVDVNAGVGHLPRVDADRVITALRLALNAPIAMIHQEQDNEGLMAYGGGGTSWGRSPPPLGPFATLDQEKATQVTHFWQLLQTSPNMDLLRLPLRRWESSLLRSSLEDRLIDAWISLEALLLGVKEELSFRAGVRLAELLGTNGVDRKAIYDATRVSYDWRSLIVHGSNSKKFPRSHPLQETVRLTTEYLRSALLKVLSLSGRFAPAKLESDLLSRESGS